MEMTKITKNQWLISASAPSLLKDTPNSRIIEVGKKVNERKGAARSLKFPLNWKSSSKWPKEFMWEPPKLAGRRFFSLMRDWTSFPPWQSCSTVDWCVMNFEPSRSLYPGDIPAHGILLQRSEPRNNNQAMTEMIASARSSAETLLLFRVCLKDGALKLCSLEIHRRIDSPLTPEYDVHY